MPSPVQDRAPTSVLSPIPSSVGNTPVSYLVYLAEVCDELPSNFCEIQLSGSYCITVRIGLLIGAVVICQGHDFSLLDPHIPSPPSDVNVYKASGCSNIVNRDVFVVR